MENQVKHLSISSGSLSLSLARVDREFPSKETQGHTRGRRWKARWNMKYLALDLLFPSFLCHWHS